MATIKDSAKAYQPKQTKNIADLPQVSTDAEIREGKGTDKDGIDFTYNYIDINGEEHRVPDIVLSQLKDMMELKPDMKLFRVERTGSGLATRYKTKFLA